MKHLNVLVLMEWYDHPLRVGIGRYAAEQEWHLTVNDGCMLPKGWSGDGILTMFATREDIVRYIKRQKIPRVDIGDYRTDVKLPRVCGDHKLIGKVGADHLIERGYRHAAYFSTEYQRPHELRGNGFSARFLECTGNAAVPLVWADAPGREIDDRRTLNRWLRKKLDNLPNPLGIFCYCDYDAAKVESVCLEAGCDIPGDVAILGVDNDKLVCENIRIPLSSVRHDRVRIGYEGAALLHKLMSGTSATASARLVPPCGVELRASTDAFAADDLLARGVIKFFRDNLGGSIGVAEAARHAGMTSQKLEEHFNRTMGETVYNVLTKLRFFEVKRLLTLTDMPVKEIARQTGFCHGQHLNNAFKRLEGLTPGRYRIAERQKTAQTSVADIE
ncbi:MAG: substrate-binding domain-containing protein [Kiritimatiellae bacterium]|nr:substrate-binding domain-containing protein [Kiritimatiellia bacterium]MDD4024841.1 substrate-binding domain-containing protein [Kiritimatiellia bacterium]